MAFASEMAEKFGGDSSSNRKNKGDSLYAKVTSEDESYIARFVADTKFSEMASRLRICADSVGGVRALSAKSGVPERTLHNWLSGGDPNIKGLIAISVVCGKSIDWLATGEGPELLADRAPAGDDPVDEALLEMIIEELEIFRRERGLRWGPNLTARLIGGGYAIMLEEREGGREPNPALLKHLFKVAS